MPIPFFATITDPSHQGSRLSHFAESYFNLGQQKYQLIRINPKSKEVELREESQLKASILATVLKIISYATIIFPLLMLTVKAIYRMSHSFKMMKNKDFSEVIAAKQKEMKRLAKATTSEEREDLFLTLNEAARLHFKQAKIEINKHAKEYRPSSAKNRSFLKSLSMKSKKTQSDALRKFFTHFFSL